MSNYDMSNWHSSCSGKYVVGNGGFLYAVCPICGIVAGLEDISAKISASDACKDGVVVREVLGQQSPNVDKGGYKQ